MVGLQRQHSEEGTLSEVIVINGGRDSNIKWIILILPLLFSLQIIHPLFIFLFCFRITKDYPSMHWVKGKVRSTVWGTGPSHL